MKHLLVAATLSTCGVTVFSDAPPPRPNILFIAIDDLNDWIGCLGGHPQTITPNFDRLAASGVLFTNAHCPAPSCNPSRTAIMTGISPHVSGLYTNGQKMREILPKAPILPQMFRDNGYRATGSGKMLHYFIDGPSWDEYFPEGHTENPFPPTYYPKKRPVNLPVGGAWQYRETDWAALPVTDEEFGGDWAVSEWVGERLRQTHEQPFFLACGIYRPHEPWFVPDKYFKPFPLESIQLPPGYKENDLGDLPPTGQRVGPNRYFEHIRSLGKWKEGVQGYLASIHFADAMLGRVLDALEGGPHADNTIVVLWSDHGWHLGEKEHWQKYTGWRAATRVPLMVRVPENASPSFSAGTPTQTVCDQPVSLLSIVPTLLDLAGLPPVGQAKGPSLRPLLADANASWKAPSLTFLGTPGAYTVNGRAWRLIHYANGDEELYHIKNDPYEWNNLANDKQHDARRDALRALAPTSFSKAKAPSFEALSTLPWIPASKTTAPPSKPAGGTFNITFENRRKRPVDVFWMGPNGQPKSYGMLKPGSRKKQSSRPGAVWRFDDPDTGKELGHVTVGDRSAKALILPVR